MSQLNHLKKIFLSAAAITGLSLGSAQAQITYTQNWETAGLNSWTTSGSADPFTRSTITPCTGSGAVMANIYYGTNSILQSPALTGSNGGDITVSFNYKLTEYSSNTTGATDIGNILVQWATSPTGTWTTAGIIDASSHTVSASCANKSFNIVNVPATGSIYIRFNAISASIADNYIYFDDVTISQQSNQSCWAPSNPIIGLVTDNSAGLSWTAPVTAPSQGYEYYFSTSSTAPTAATPASGTAPAGTTTVAMSPLQGNTVYYAWIRSSCGSSKSGWNMINPFITEKLTPRPWTEDCSDITTFDRWEAQAGDWYLGTASGMTGNPGDMLFVNQYSTDSDTASISSHNIGPVLATDSFRFDYKVAQYSTPYGPVLSGSGYMKVLISTDFGQNYTQLDSLPHPSSTAWITKSYPLTSYAGQKVKIKVASYWNSTVADDYNIGFDNFFIGAPPCTPPVVNLGADTTICNGTTLTLNAGNTTGATYTWSTGATTPTLAVNTAGTYYVTVTQGACATADTIVVNTSANPTVALGADTTLCDVSTFPLDAGAGTGYTYLWNNNVTARILDVTTSGTYSVTVTNANGCTASDEITVVFSTMPTVNGITATGNPSPAFNFEANGANNAEDYHWDFGHNGATATGATASYTYPSLSTPATYTVTLTISNDCGEVEVSTVVTVNPVSINDLALDNNTLKLFPNPGSHAVKLINESNYKMKQIIVSNILGQTVATIPVRNNAQQTIDVSRLPAGLYNVRIEFEEGTVIRKLEVIK
ncbi:MAG: T9SS type A sorting domain-containing protein [Sphingobacteriales bacterium]|nr:MAG: T9SS type A sorting domain-containing protein [Sphingobacteriales bacterium]